MARDRENSEPMTLEEKRRYNDDRETQKLHRGSHHGEPREPAGEAVFPGGTDADLKLTDGNQASEERLRAAATQRHDRSAAESDTQEQDPAEQRRKVARLNREPAEG